MADEQPPDEHAGTAQLVQVLAQISNLSLAFPTNPKIRLLGDAAAKCLDPELCQAILMENARLQNEQTQQRQSPLAAQMMEWTKRK